MPAPNPSPASRPPKDWTSKHRANGKMTPWQWATAPWKMVQWGRRRYDVHLMYLPSPLLRRIKQAISQGGLLHGGTAAGEARKEQLAACWV